ncbi:MAG: CoA transferase [Reichenbachiella sp.]
MKPLEGITVLEFCQYMAGPSAGLKLADLGARVIKIERPGVGEGGRKITIKNLFVGDDSLVFHTINRNKQSYAANLKDPEDLKRIKKLIAVCDVMTHNFRPGVMEKIGLDYEAVSSLNKRLVYGVVTGYGQKGPWATKPGQDLLVQSLSGLNLLTGNADSDPTPMGLATSDILTGAHLVQGILSALVKRGKTNEGSMVEVSLLESTLDFQFEVLTTYLNDGRKQPIRAEKGNAHAYLSAPYGVYKTKDKYISIAMMPVTTLADELGIVLPEAYKSSESWFVQRNEIMALFQKTFLQKTTKEWLLQLEANDLWCADVFDYKDLLNHEGYQVLKMDQKVTTSSGEMVRTTRCPIRVDEERFFSRKSAPKVGEDTQSIIEEFDL